MPLCKGLIGIDRRRFYRPPRLKSVSGMSPAVTLVGSIDRCAHPTYVPRGKVWVQRLDYQLANLCYSDFHTA